MFAVVLSILTKAYWLKYRPDGGSVTQAIGQLQIKAAFKDRKTSMLKIGSEWHHITILSLLGTHHLLSFIIPSHFH